MSTQPSVLLVHDAEIDDQFNRLLLTKCSLLYGEYLCSDVSKLSGPPLEVKAKLFSVLFQEELQKIPTFITNGKGELTNGEQPILGFTKMFNDFMDQDRKKILVLTGQCAPIFEIVSSLIQPEHDLTIVWINGKHNGANCAKGLTSIAKHPNVRINEFNSYSSVSGGVKDFDPSIEETADCGSLESLKVERDTVLYNYGKVFNGSLFNKPWFFSKVKECLGVDVRPHVEENFSNDKLVKELDGYLQEILSGDFDQQTKGYFKPKLSMWRREFIQFPLHDLAASIIVKGDPILKPVEAYAYDEGGFIQIRPEKKEGAICKVLHFYAPDPKGYVQEINKVVQENIV